MEQLRLGKEMEVKAQIEEIYERVLRLDNYELLYQTLFHMQLFFMQVAVEYQINIWQLNEFLMEKEDLEDSVQKGFSKLENAVNFICEEIGKRRKDGKNIRLVKQYIIENYMDSTMSVKSIAQAVFLNENYLSTCFKKQSGISLSEFITKFRMKKAKELLENSGWEIQEIALKTGYLDANYFSKCFKKVYGKTPKKYLKDIK